MTNKTILFALTVLLLGAAVLEADHPCSTPLILDMSGDGDGLITHKDRVWNRLRLWVDENHDAVSQRQEIATLPSQGVRAIGLDFERVDRRSGNGNLHLLGGQFVKRVEILGEEFERFEVIEDILFVVREDGEDDEPPF